MAMTYNNQENLVTHQKKNSCVAVIVTYNRKDLLCESVSALLSQTVPCDIIIVDNASKDGTSEYLLTLRDPRIIKYNTGSNLGGAGGFAFGIEMAQLLDYKYIWVMDDDAIPRIDALASLLNKAEMINDDFSYLASLVYWTDDYLFRMNVPCTTYSYKEELRIIDLLSKKKIIPIHNASFVGCFINNIKCINAGLPISEFFIYGDDLEYTSRLNEFGEAYLDLDSVIIHKAPSNTGADIVTAPRERIERFFYQSRNGIYMARKEHRVLYRLCKVVSRAIKILLKSPDCKYERLRVLFKGTLAGLSFNPQIRYVGKKE